MATDSYRAIYDATLAAFDISYLKDSFREAAYAVETAGYEQKRPSVLFRPTLSADGDMWCALLGDNLQEGVAGFGKTPAEAMTAFDMAFLNERTPTAIRLEREQVSA